MKSLESRLAVLECCIAGLEARMQEEYEKCVETCNVVYSMYSRREGRYRDDQTARSWLRIVNEHYGKAQVLYYIQHGFLPADGVLPGITYVPGPQSYKGKAS